MRVTALTALTASLLLASSPLIRRRRPGEGTGALLVAAQAAPSALPSIVIESDYCGCELDEFGACFDPGLPILGTGRGDCIPDFVIELYSNSSFRNLVRSFNCPRSSFDCVWENVPVSGNIFYIKLHDLALDGLAHDDEDIAEVTIPVSGGVATVATESETNNAPDELTTISVVPAPPITETTTTTAIATTTTATTATTATPITVTTPPRTTPPQVTNDEDEDDEDEDDEDEDEDEDDEDEDDEDEDEDDEDEDEDDEDERTAVDEGLVGGIDAANEIEQVNLGFFDLWRFQTDRVTVLVLASLVAIVLFLGMLSVTVDGLRHAGRGGKTTTQTSSGEIAYTSQPQISPNSQRRSVSTKSASVAQPRGSAESRLSIVELFPPSAKASSSMPPLAEGHSTATEGQQQQQGETRRFHARILLTGLALVDFLGDWLFVAERFRLAEMAGANADVLGFSLAFPPLLPLIFVAAPMVVNIGIVTWVLVIEFRSAAMRNWFQSHSMIGTVIIILSLGHIDVLSMLHSRTFGCRRQGSAFNAPFSTRTQQNFFWFGIVGHFLEDIPQICFQLVVIITESASVITIIAFATSALTLLFGITRRLVFTPFFWRTIVVVIITENASVITIIAFATSALTLLFGITRRLVFVLLVSAARSEQKRQARATLERQKQTETEMEDKSITDSDDAFHHPHASMSSAEGFAPASASTRREGYAPASTRRDSFAPASPSVKRESFSTRRESFTPRRDSFTPRRDSFTPRRDSFTPRRDSFARDSFSPSSLRRESFANASSRRDRTSYSYRAEVV